MEDSRVTSVGGNFADQFQELFAEEELTDPGAFADVEVFDELPIYSYFDQLAFLDGLSILEKNSELIMAAVRHVDHLNENLRSQRADPDRIIRMVSIAGWWVDGEYGGGICTDGSTELLLPYIFVGNLGHERMKDFKVHRPRSRAASFVADLAGSAYVITEDELNEVNGWCPTRVNVTAARHFPASIIAYNPGISGAGSQ
jgi:hypothetical protein